MKENNSGMVELNIRIPKSRLNLFKKYMTFGYCDCEKSDEIAELLDLDKYEDALLLLEEMENECGESDKSTYYRSFIHFMTA